MLMKTGALFARSKTKEGERTPRMAGDVTPSRGSSSVLKLAAKTNINPPMSGPPSVSIDRRLARKAASVKPPKMALVPKAAAKTTLGE